MIPFLGCGASCIYPLLAARKNNWKLFGLETNADSVLCAQENVTKNGLNSNITILKQTSNDQIFGKVLSMPDIGQIDFCMCNPPFYSSIDDFDHSNSKNNRTGKRPAPSNRRSGCKDELIVDGGECDFVEKIIRESCSVRERIQVFTTMLGHKTSVTKMLSVLNLIGITNFCQTEFCQGRTTRWGLAWSFNSNILLRNVLKQGVHIPKKKLFHFEVPDCGNRTVADVLDWLKLTFQQIHIHLEHIQWVTDKADVVSCRIVAMENTWSKQRRKRREIQRTHQPQLENTINTEIESFYDSDRNSEVAIKRRRIEVNSSQEELPISPILVVGINISKNPKTATITISLTYLSGSAEQDGVYQILQFLRNRWK